MLETFAPPIPSASKSWEERRESSFSLFSSTISDSFSELDIFSLFNKSGKISKVSPCRCGCFSGVSGARIVDHTSDGCTEEDAEEDLNLVNDGKSC